MYGLLTLIALKRRSLRIHISLSSLLPVFVGLDSERVVFLGLAADLVLGLDISGNDEPDGGGSGADFLLLRVSGPCEGNLLWAIDSALEPVLLRVRDGGRDNGTEDPSACLSALEWDNTGGGIGFIAT